MGPYAVGYAFAAFGGSFWPLSDPLWKLDGRAPATATEDPHDPFMGRLVGLVERPLYVTSLLANAPAFVGVWRIRAGRRAWD